MEFLGWCLGISIVGWLLVGFISLISYDIKKCVEIKQNIDKIKKNNKKK